ncbi:MAG: hypothetical protein NAG76_14255 [Candidatus Pristimantibacillus lignocellulolyticus]|uniref:Uncharacterized protein n=1 Tax=Candidatus Pristimantibacillus lignocellulolyticus TaxID=2994561 RepID=A0A9J6ZAC1_9BACL|nr:MAG: hypothetical protein NAG76_14255 [Candidatus Pristimantibacillus lignocellulolyticus]
MNKENLKKNITKLLVLFVGIFIIYSIYIHLEYRQYINQSKDRNYQYLSHISATGDNLANKLKEFIKLPIEQEENSELKREFYDNWRIVNGESKSIYSYISTISTLHMGDEAADWDLLQYSLIRVDSFIYGLTNKFLEHYSYATSSEENEKMEAVITIYRTIRAETENESVDLEIILQSIKEPMLVIDDNYPGILERMDR